MFVAQMLQLDRTFLTPIYTHQYFMYVAFDLRDFFKIETVRDNFMACSDLTKDQKDDHTLRLANLAVTMLKISRETVVDEENPSSPTISIRVELDCGRIISTVANPQYPRFSVVGETVNTVNRLATHCLRDHIQCSEEFAAILCKQGPHFSIKPGSMMTIKGRPNAMRTFWVADGILSSVITHSTSRSCEQANLRDKFANLMPPSCFFCVKPKSVTMKIKEGESISVCVRSSQCPS